MSDPVLTERYLRNGSCITFEERDTGYRAYHYQPVEGKRVRLPSVTTVLGVLAKDALIRWSEEQGIRGAAEAINRAYIDPRVRDVEGWDMRVEPDELVQAVRRNTLGADGARDRAATRGLDIHSIWEEWARTSNTPNPADHPAEHAPYIQAAARALIALDPEPIASEQLVAHADLGYAGRYDARCVIEGRETLLDLKTSATGIPYPEGHAQLVAYDLAAQWCGEPPAERLVVVGLGADGSFTANECGATPEHWESILACYRTMGEIRRPIDAMRRAAKKAAGQEQMAA